ncbi:Imm8 family immunity protein [Spirosoma endophyticum]|uniref:Immunity protein 8 n=1 Tax=Spirosoma endophyticum TaxID=662367 RepID=A0A1I1FBE7_9BACT|nr:Imm8 family immunity protein [Spirosoma endophyticum]SFB96601.1 Immunity protein 8 [Spirosoma endophyticum]
MKPIIVDFDSSDVLDLFSYRPKDFGFPLNLNIGTTEGKGADNFQLMVATPKYLKKMHPGQSAVLLRHVLLVFHYDFTEILDVLTRYIQPVEKDS